MNDKKFGIASYFENPILQVSLDLNSELLTELALQLQNQDKEGAHETNIGGWQSENISEEKWNFDISDYSSGTYMIEILPEAITYQIVKQ